MEKYILGKSLEILELEQEEIIGKSLSEAKEKLEEFEKMVTSAITEVEACEMEQPSAS